MSPADSVEFGDDGRVTIAGPDAKWESRVSFPQSPITVAAQSSRIVGLTVHMPARISPDLYFVGFLVTPLPDAAGNLTYVNQIGSYVTINVPGPRVRTLTADLHLPDFALTTLVRGTLHLHNVGRAAATYWGENDTTATPGSSAPRQERIGESLLPAGRSRTITLDAKPSFLIAVVTVHVHVIYPGRSNATTKEIVLTKRVLVVQPGALVLLGLALFAATIWYVHRRRKRRPPSPGRSGRGKAVTPGRRTSGPHPVRSRRRRSPAPSNARARIDRQLAIVRAEEARTRSHGPSM